jgi:hypothetical protein
VPLLTLAVREPANRQEIVALEQADAVVEVEAISPLKLGVDVEESGPGQARLHLSEPSNFTVL